MKPSFLIIQTLSIFILSWLFCLILPWYTFAIIAFLSGIIFHRQGFMSFMAGFAGSGLFYLIVSLIKARGDSFAFANKIGEILGSSAETNISGVALMAIGTIIFSILGGAFAWSGTLILSSEPSNRLSSARGRSRTKGLKLDLKKYS
ncbi:MAG TPA: hypothetical protein VLZ75_12890 [Chitinophagales bacterium]|nr:hypothetical protein [Chitinophagales bacterium]